ncbi:MAG: hypothetical protein F4Y02_10990, partial [Chloroflexi bacterium]|nr:hypothetical protein [Chloroflexota bacterium]
MTTTKPKTTPLRRQYLDIKQQQPDAILLFRLGDFYEMFDEDAERAAAVLQIVLTSREFGKGNRVSMCGVPCPEHAPGRPGRGHSHQRPG